MSDLQVLELFSGIGGMRLACERAGFSYGFRAIEINPLANSVYKENFGEDDLQCRNIVALNADDFSFADALLMSPPCQPFSRNGNQLGSKDSRTEPLLHVIELLQHSPEIPRYILLENVVGFETSDSFQAFASVLSIREFYWRTFIISPTVLGIPNSRSRFFCLARRELDFPWPKGNEPCSLLPSIAAVEPTMLSTFLNTSIPNDAEGSFEIDPRVAEKYNPVMDIVTLDDKRSCCFTKAYGRYFRGTGSVVRTESGLRLFSPIEVAKLMGFPDQFKFPPSLTRRQQYALLGNSINVVVVSQLLMLLFL